MHFRGALTDPDSLTVALQVEVKPIGVPFDGVNNLFTGSYVASGAVSEVIVTKLLNGDYHWRARAVDNSGAKSVNWTSFGGNLDVVGSTPAEMDFMVARIGGSGGGLPPAIEEEKGFLCSAGSGVRSSGPLCLLVILLLGAVRRRSVS